MTYILRFFTFRKIIVIGPFLMTTEKYSFFKIILPTFLCFCMKSFNKNILIKSWNVYFHLALDWNNAAWPIWWQKQLIKRCQLNESVVSINNMSCVFLLTCVWGFWFLKVQKFNLSPTLALNYTKATLSRVGLVSCSF